MGLLGPSSTALAIFISEILHTRPVSGTVNFEDACALWYHTPFV